MRVGFRSWFRLFWMVRVREMGNVLCLLRSPQIEVRGCVCVFLSISTHLFLHLFKNVFYSYTNADLRMASGEAAFTLHFLVILSQRILCKHTTHVTCKHNRRNSLHFKNDNTIMFKRLKLPYVAAKFMP